jgi:hypothetical protein
MGNLAKRLAQWFDMKVLQLLSVIINRRINSYLPDLNIKVDETVRWKISIAGMQIGFSANVPTSYEEMGKVLESIGKVLKGTELKGTFVPPSYPSNLD